MIVALTQPIRDLKLGNPILVLAIGILIAADLAVAAEAHLLCNIFCIHGGMDTLADICSGTTN